MSMFERRDYRWRETFFIVFAPEKRPQAQRVVEALRGLSEHYTVENVQANEQGEIESLTLLAPEDNAALDVSFASGPEIVEEQKNLIEEMQPLVVDKQERRRLAKIAEWEARFDVLHFEHVEADSAADEALDETLDPGALLLAVDVLAELTGGVAIDPQSGTVM